MAAKKKPNILWIASNSDALFRKQGKVQFRKSSVLAKLISKKFKVQIMVPYDSNLLPKTPLAPSRTQSIRLMIGRPINVDIIKLSKGLGYPTIYMVRSLGEKDIPSSFVFGKAVLAYLKKSKFSPNLIHAEGSYASWFPLLFDLERGKTSKPAPVPITSVFSLPASERFLDWEKVRNFDLPQGLVNNEFLTTNNKADLLRMGLAFSHRVGMVSLGKTNARKFNKVKSEINNLYSETEGKIRHWSSDRSVKDYLDLFEESQYLKNIPHVLPNIIRGDLAGIDNSPSPKTNGREEKGKPASLGFHMQGESKAFVYWTVPNGKFKSLSLVMNELDKNRKYILAQGIPPVGELWLGVEPGENYQIELVGKNLSNSVIKINATRPMKSSGRKFHGHPSDKSTWVNVQTRRKVNSKHTSTIQEADEQDPQLVIEMLGSWSWTLGPSSGFGISSWGSFSSFR